MKHIYIAGLVAITAYVVGCHPKHEEDWGVRVIHKNPCASAGYYYSVEYTNESNDSCVALCGSIPKTLIDIPASGMIDVPDGCKIGPHYRYDGCAEVEDIVCGSEYEGSFFRDYAFIVFADDGSSGSGTLYRMKYDSGKKVCESSYDVKIIRAHF